MDLGDGMFLIESILCQLRCAAWDGVLLGLSRELLALGGGPMVQVCERAA